jgi:hypothetical protein
MFTFVTFAVKIMLANLLYICKQMVIVIAPSPFCYICEQKKSAPVCLLS